VAEALDAAGVAGRWVAPTAEVDGDAVLLLAHHLVPPHMPAPLMAADVPHVPVVFAADGVTVGPVVRPGRTACLACLAAHERDRDPAWPALASQLVARRPGAVPRASAMEAGTLAARLLRAAVGTAAPTATTSVRSTADGRRAWRSHRPHETCLCRATEGPDRSPRGSATAPAPLARSPDSTRSTGCARRA